VGALYLPPRRISEHGARFYPKHVARKQRTILETHKKLQGAAATNRGAGILPAPTAVARTSGRIANSPVCIFRLTSSGTCDSL